MAHANSIPLYTEGYKSDGNVGFGVVFEASTFGGSLPALVGIYTAELSDILHAVRAVCRTRHARRRFVIFVDSQSALQVLERYNPVHPMVLNILRWLLVADR